MRNPYDLIGRLGLLLAIAGAVNWLLVGLFEWNLVQWLFTQSGTQTVDNLGERIVYIVVGVGGVLALPMLAASLARSRSRDVSAEDRGTATAGAREDDTAFYYGAPKNERELAHEPQRAQPVRRIERVIVEEPLPETSAEAAVAAGGGEGVSESLSPEDRLRYGPVEEADEGLGEGYDEERRAA